MADETNPLEQAIEKIKSHEETPTNCGTLGEAISLLEQAEREQQCPHCLGSGIEPSTDKDLGGNGITNCLCLQCEGKKTYRAWAEKEIEELAKLLSMAICPQAHNYGKESCRFCSGRKVVLASYEAAKGEKK